MHAYSNQRRTVEKFLKEFKAHFGPPGTIKIIFGDWGARAPGSHLQYSEPTIKKAGFLMLENAGYEVIWWPEFRTSKMCSSCLCAEGINEKFLLVESPKPWRAGHDILCHGLVRCQKCKAFWNRDLNACRNMLVGHKHWVEQEEIHPLFRRPAIAQQIAGLQQVQQQEELVPEALDSDYEGDY